MTSKPPPAAKADEIVVHVPKGSAGNVRIVEVDPKVEGRDITIQVSKNRKVEASAAIGVIVK